MTISAVEAEWNMRCPECGSSDHLSISVKGWAILTVDGTEVDQACHEWDDGSACICENCGWQGWVRDAYRASEEAAHEADARL